MVTLNLFSHKTSPLGMAIDVGTHSIKAIAFEIEDGIRTPRSVKKAVIKLPAHVHTQKTLQSPDDARQISRMVARLRELIFTLIKELGRVPGRITIGFGMGFGNIELATWQYRVESERGHISLGDITRVFASLEKKTEDPCCTTFVHPIELLLNGYGASARVAEHIPPRGIQEIGFRVLLTRLTREVGLRLLEMKQSLGGLPIEFVPLPAVYHKGIATLSLPDDSLFIDIGGEATTLAFFRKKELASFTSFNYGLHQMVRGIGDAINIPLESVEEMFFQYARGVMNDSKKAEFQHMLSPYIAEWKAQFLSALDAFYHVGPLPADIFVIGGGAELPELIEVIKDPLWIKDYSAFDKPEVRILEATNFFGGENLGGLLGGPEEVGLASLILYSLSHESVLA